MGIGENIRAQGLILDPRALALLFEASEAKPAKDFKGKYCEDGKVKVIPKSTKYRLLKRLAEMGYLKTLEGVDRRYRFYKLSESGELIKRRLIKRMLKDMPSELPFTLKVPLAEFKRVSCSYGIPPKLLLKELGAKITKDILGNEYVVVSGMMWS